jgi:hypothetical protein
MLLGESSNETEDKTDHNTEDEHLKQGIGLLEQCGFSPDSIKDLNYLMVRRCYHFQTKAAHHAKLKQVQVLH